MAPSHRKNADKLFKVVDNSYTVGCAVGVGEFREEVWMNASGEKVRYNLAFINQHVFADDNGRVLGYDTAHGRLHRHFAGVVEPTEAASYSEILERFIAEVDELRKRKML